jgi:hypothetical protein
MVEGTVAREEELSGSMRWLRVGDGVWGETAARCSKVSDAREGEEGEGEEAGK